MSSMRRRVRSLSREDRAVYEELAGRFEAAWSQSAGQEPKIETLLPRGPARAPLLIHCVKCDLEFRRARGESRRVEEYLARFGELRGDPEAQLELLLWEYGLGRQDAESRESMARRFPDLAERFREAVGELEPAGPWEAPEMYEVDPVPLGRGGWGVVYKARHKRRERWEAIKVVDPRATRGRQGKSLRARIQRLRAEIPVAARLNHPNVVHFYADDEYLGQPYFMMEYCPGGSLKERLAKGPMPPRDAALLVRTLAAAVHHIHAFGLVHRDLKPSNVLFGQGDVPKIADFGLALAYDSKETPSADDIVGTPTNMAPEQIDPRKGKVGPATDVYGLGTILYECLTQEVPFTGTSVQEIFRRVCDEAPPSPRRLRPDTPVDLDAACRLCMSKNPCDRYPDAQALAADLDRILAGAPAQGSPRSPIRQPPLRRTTYWIRTNPAKSVAMLLLLALVAGIGLVRASQLRTEAERANERAVEAARRADSERREKEAIRDREHAALVTLARRSAERGDWVSAFPAFDKAIAARSADAPRLRVERLIGYFALNRTKELGAELDALEKAPLGELAPRVKLMAAAWLLCDTGRQAEGRKLARQALAEGKGRFDSAEEHFGHGLAAATVGESLRHYERAFHSDPMNYMAASCYVTALAAVGRHEEAVRQAAFMRSIFKSSAVPDLVEALTAFSDGDRNRVKTALAAAASRLPAEQKEGIERLHVHLLALTDLQDIAVRYSAGEVVSDEEFQSVAPMLARAYAVAGRPNAAPLGIPIPTASLLMTRVLDVYSVYTELSRQTVHGIDDPQLRRIERIVDDCPDAGIMLLLAVVKLREAIQSVNAADLPTIRGKLLDVSNRCEVAKSAPMLTSRTPVRYLARGLGCIVDVGQAKLDRVPASAHITRLRSNLLLVVEEGKRWPKLRSGLIDLFVRMATAPLTPAQAADWQLEQSKGREAFAQRRAWIVDLCKGLLSDWEFDEPNAALLASLREQVAQYEQSSGLTAKKN